MAGKDEGIFTCEGAGVISYVVRPQPNLAINEGYFAKDEFSHDTQEDCYTCPGGQRLDPYARSQKNGDVAILYAKIRACRSYHDLAWFRFNRSGKCIPLAEMVCKARLTYTRELCFSDFSMETAMLQHKPLKTWWARQGLNL